MNEVIEVIKSRRSVRSFEDKEITRDKLEAIIDAGNWAPSGNNVQPWRFVVIQDANLRQKLHDVALERYTKWYDSAGEEMQAGRRPIDAVVDDPVYYSAPVIIFVIATKTMTYSQDCPMVCLNMMLAAWSFGIGSCWVGFGQMPLQNEEIRQALELAENEKVFGPIVFGYPKKSDLPTPRKKPPVVKWI